MTTFSDYEARDRPRQTRSCRVCGAETVGRVVVTIAKRDGGKYPLLDSRAATFCETHAIEAYEGAIRARPDR